MIVLSKLLFAVGVVIIIALSNANKNLRGRQLEENLRQLQNEMNLNNGRTLVRIIIFFLLYTNFDT